MKKVSKLFVRGLFTQTVRVHIVYWNTYYIIPQLSLRKRLVNWKFEVVWSRWRHVPHHLENFCLHWLQLPLFACIYFFPGWSKNWMTLSNHPYLSEIKILSSSRIKNMWRSVTCVTLEKVVFLYIYINSIFVIAFHLLPPIES